MIRVKSQKWRFDFKLKDLGPFWMVTSMSVRDVGDEMCWQQFVDVADGFLYFVNDIL